MKSTKKMVLIPFSKYERLLDQEHIKQNPVQSEQEEEETIKTPLVNTEPNIGKETQKLETSQLLDHDQILEHIPVKQKRNAKVLVDYILNQTEIRWSKSGELIIQHKQIPHSHITDLIKDALVIHKHFKPIGVEQFYANIGNIPITIIKNPERRQLIIDNRSNKPQHSNNSDTPQTHNIILPPPGQSVVESRSLDSDNKKYSVKKKISKPKSVVNWKKLWQTI